MKFRLANSVEIVIFSLYGNESKFERCYQLLSDDEKRRAAAFRFDKHRDRFVSGRGAIREILADRINCRPEAIRFSLNPHGKPSIAEPQSGARIQFNASSSAVTGAIAIAEDLSLGFDIEKIIADKLDDYDSIVENHFTSPEQRWYRNRARQDRCHAFFRLWTCKEAYLKALGIGLSGELDSFTIDLRGAQPAVSHTGLENDGRSRLLLHQFEIEEDFVACLALPQKPDRIGFSHW